MDFRSLLDQLHMLALIMFLLWLIYGFKIG